MAIDFLLQTYVSHVSSVIVWLVVGCLGLIALYLLLSLRQEKLQVEGGQANFTQLEETLKKVLENTSGIGGKEAAQKLAVPSAHSDAGQAEAARLAAEVEAQTKLVLELEKKLALASAAGSNTSAPAAAGVDTSALEGRIKSLEAKLAEYQVVEDDIANLSLYREENVRLKDEIDRLKGGAAPAAAPVATAAVAKDDGVAEFEAALKQQEAAAKEAPPLAAVDAATAAQDDLMAEFEAIVKTQKQQEVAASSNSEISRAVEAPIDQDVMGDFESTVRHTEPPKTAAPSPAGPPALAVVPAVKPEPPPVKAEPAPQPETAATAEAAVKTEALAATPPALAVQLDTDQMVSEINNYQATPATAATEVSEGDRLIAEFENFVTKEGDS